MLRVGGKSVSTEGALSDHFNCKNEWRQQHTLVPIVQASSLLKTEKNSSCWNSKSPQLTNQQNKAVKTCATRRRRMAYTRSDTYVLLEPGEEEKFVSGEELKAKLKGLLENWPGKGLPPDLARFATIDEAVSFLVNSVCELELEGDVVGSVQWFEVSLE